MPAIVLLTCAAQLVCGAVGASVTAEYGEIRDGHWAFPTIAEPSRSDLARHASLRLLSGTLEPRGRELGGLVDGTAPCVGGIQQAGVSFASADEEGGAVLMDLGSVRAVREVDTYSFHRYEPDGGARGPQVYTLYGSTDDAAASAPDPRHDARWTRIADVDSRPNASGDGWGGRVHAVRISDGGAGLGLHRYLLWVIEPTRSPRAYLPRYTHTMYAEFDVHSAETLAASEPAERWAPFPDVKHVTIAFKTHFDLGYTGLAREVIYDYRTGMIGRALATADECRGKLAGEHFVWTLPGWVAEEVLDHQAPEDADRRERVAEALRDGTLAVHALPFTSHTETYDLEDLCRGLTPASTVCREMGLALPRDAKMTDVPSHAWVLPTLLANAGIDFLHLGANPSCQTPEVPSLFWWEGPDGSRVLTQYSRNYADGLMPPTGWPYRSWLALIHSHDNEGPPPAYEVAQWIDEAPELFPGAEIHIGRMSDFADAIGSEEAPIPTVRGDMPDTWIYGPMSDPIGVAAIREARANVAAGETLRTQTRAWGLDTTDVRETVRRIYADSLLFGEHTWGGSLAWLDFRLSYGDLFREERAAGRFARTEESWDEHAAYARSASERSGALLREGLIAVARSVDVAGPRAVVHNPLPWTRDGEVTVAWPGPLPAWVGTPGGAPVPTTARDGEVTFVAHDVPPNGYVTYVPAREGGRAASGLSADTGRCVIESRYFRARLDPDRGAIQSLVDKRTRRELVDRSSPYGLGQSLYERFDRSQVDAYLAAYTVGGGGGALDFGKPSLPSPEGAPYEARTVAGSQLSTELFPDRAEATLRTPAGRGLPYGVSLRVTLPADRAEVRLEVAVEGKPLEPWPEAGWMCLPLRIDEPRYLLGRVGSLTNPARDLISGSNHHLFWLNTGLTVTEPSGRGVGVCPVDHPLVALGEPGCWRYDREYEPPRPTVFVNLFNNQWSTDFRLWSGGSWTSRVTLWAVDGPDPEQGLITPSLEARYPLVATALDAPSGGAPATRAGLGLSRGGVQVTAFGPNPDGPGTILRLWELAGRGGPCLVSLPEGIRVEAVRPVDLRGRAVGRAVAVRDGRFRVHLRPFGPTSLVLAQPTRQ